MIVHIGYDVCVEAEDVLMILSPRTIAGPAAGLMQNAKKQGAYLGVPPHSKAACRAYLLLQPPSDACGAPPNILRLAASCLSPAALQRRLQVPSLLPGKDME